MRTGRSNLGMRSVAVALSAAAKRDAAGAVIVLGGEIQGDVELAGVELLVYIRPAH